MHAKLILVAGLVGLAGIILFGIGVASWLRDRDFQSWPTVPASLISSAIVKTTRAEVHGALNSPSRTARPETRLVDGWVLDVHYRYSLDGREFRGSQATSSPVFEAIDVAPVPSVELQELAAEIARLSPVVAHVNPGNPAQSYLIFRSGLLVSALSWGAFLTAAAATALVARKQLV